MKKKKKAVDEVKLIVLEMDHYACRNPVCNSRNKLFKDNIFAAHDIILTSQGGEDSPANRIALCRVCHTCVHEGGHWNKEPDRIPGHTFMLRILTYWWGRPDFRWPESYESVKKLVEFKSGRY